MAGIERVTVTLSDNLLRDIDRREKNRTKFIAEAVRHELERRRRAELRRSLENPRARNSPSRGSMNGRGVCPTKIARCSSTAAPVKRFGGFPARAGWSWVSRSGSEVRPRHRRSCGARSHVGSRTTGHQALRGSKRSGHHQRPALSPCVGGAGCFVLGGTPGQGRLYPALAAVRAASRRSRSR
jgi:hypothetical protein